MAGFDPFAAFRKFVLGDQSADVITGVNVKRNVSPYIKDPNKDRTDMMNEIGNSMVKEGKAKIAAREAGPDQAPLTTYNTVPDAAAIQEAKDNARRNALRSEGSQTLDELMQVYEEVIKAIRNVGKDQTVRLNKAYDTKVEGQVEDMKGGMYEVDASAAASNLADSSFRSFDRGKVRKAADSNIATLNTQRDEDVSKVGSMVEGDVARYDADRDGIARTRRLLGETEDVNELQSTANNLDATLRGVRADKSKYQGQGDFVKKANALGNRDTSVLESTLQSVIDNASASPSTRQAAVNDILEGSNVDDELKKQLKTKYTQVIG